MDRHGDTTITLRTIRISEIEKWDKLDSEEFIKQNELFRYSNASSRPTQTDKQPTEAAD